MRELAKEIFIYMRQHRKNRGLEVPAARLLAAQYTMICWPLIFSVSLCFFLFSRTTSSLEICPGGGRSRVCIFNKEAVSLKTYPFFFLHDRSLPRAFLKMHQGHLKHLPLSPNSFSLEFMEYKEK